MDYKTWKSGRHEKLGRWPVDLIDTGTDGHPHYIVPPRLKCKYCMEHKHTCPVCAGVI